MRFANRMTWRILAAAISLSIASYVTAAPGRDGVIDTTFGVDGVVDVRQLSPAVSEWTTTRQILELPDGKLLLVGSVKPLSATLSYPAAMRLLPSGALDTSFGAMGVAMLPTAAVSMPNGAEASSVARLSDGRLVFAGSLRLGPAVDEATECRLVFAMDSDGAVVSTYGPAPGPACSYFGTTWTFLGPRLLPQGVVVADGSDRAFFTIQRRRDDNMIVSAVARLSNPGQVDVGYGVDGFAAAQAGLNFSLRPQGTLIDDTGTLTLLASSALDSTFPLGLMRVLPNGTIDATFDGDGFAIANFGTSDRDGRTGTAIFRDELDRIYLTAHLQEGAQVVCDFCVARLLPNGSLDTTFNATGQQLGVPGTARLLTSNQVTGYQVQVLPGVDGGVKLAGSAVPASNTNGVLGFAIFSLRGDGSFDPRFGDLASPGRLSLNLSAEPNGAARMTAATSTSSGRILLAGNETTRRIVVRLLDDALFDDSFEN